MCGTYKEKLISTISFYVVLIPYGIGDVVLISLTECAACPRTVAAQSFATRNKFHVQNASVAQICRRAAFKTIWMD